MAVTVEDERRVTQGVPHGLFLDGEWRAASNGKTFPVHDPSTGETLATVADASTADACSALDAACAAQGEWALTSARYRAEILRRAYERLMARQDDLALLMTLEMGKPLSEARGEVSYAAEFFRWFSEEATRVSGRYNLSPDGRSRLIVGRRPVGPCVLITPWNFPLAMGTRKIGPAVAAGCTMVVKPAPQTPLSMLALAGILQECGLPAGVLNVVTTTRAAETMNPVLEDRRTKKLSFTGSTAVGQQLNSVVAGHLARVSLELGGNAPFIVFPDADLKSAVDGAMVAKMRNIGEACTAANRFLVHESVADDFTEQLAERMCSLKVGRGVNESVQVGPLIDSAARTKVTGLVEEAVEHGAVTVVGGSAIDGPGYFVSPTVLRNVPADSRMATEEIFGPVAAVNSFTDDDEVIRQANATDYGLVAYVYTSAVDRAFRVCDQLEVGMVGLNQGIVSNPAAPFGGVKQSGLGREGGAEGIEEFLDTTYIAMPR